MECKIHTRPSDIGHQQLDRQTKIQPVKLLAIDYLRKVRTDWRLAIGRQPLVGSLHIPAVIKPQMTEVGPPLGSARDKDAERAVHEFKIAKASPSIASGLKWRLSSALWHIDA